MRFVITGGTGFIGTALRKRLLKRGHSLSLLSRAPSPAGISANEKWFTWQPGSPGRWENEINGSDAVINLAGEPLAARRWTGAQKEKIWSSRVDTTRALVAAIGRAEKKPGLLLNASAVGYYGPRGAEAVTEADPPGDDFLSRLCVAWEDEAKRAEDYGVRVIRLRTGIVLGRGGGALAKMVLPFRLFIGGPLGRGNQWMSWIQMEDEIEIILYLVDSPEATGAVNATAPNPVTMAEFCQTLGRVLRRPSWAPVPSFALRLLMGEMADLLLTGQRVLPDKAQRMGYSFRYPSLSEALTVSLIR